MSIDFKNMFTKTPIHNSEYVTNEHFLIKKSILKKNQLEYINRFPMSDKMNNQIDQITKSQLDKNTITEFKPERIHKGEEYNILISEQIGVNENYYNLIQSLKCKLTIVESDYNHNPLSIYTNDNEFIGIVMPIKINRVNSEQSITYEQYLEELKLEQECKQITKLMKPLFVNGMYNREGKRIRASYLKTISHNNNEYPLWVASGKPDKDYTKNENDKYYLHIQVNDWLIMTGFTEYELKQRAGYEHLNKEWYGDFEGRSEYFNEHFYNGRTYEEYGDLVKEHIKKEETFINGGIIEGGEVIVKLADKYNVNIPLRTRGWILKSLIESDITNDGGVGYRFWKSKNGKGSQTVYRVLHDIRNAITT